MYSYVCMFKCVECNVVELNELVLAWLGFTFALAVALRKVKNGNGRMFFSFPLTIRKNTMANSQSILSAKVGHGLATSLSRQSL